MTHRSVLVSVALVVALLILGVAVRMMTESSAVAPELKISPSTPTAPALPAPAVFMPTPPPPPQGTPFPPPPPPLSPPQGAPPVLVAPPPPPPPAPPVAVPKATSVPAPSVQECLPWPREVAAMLLVLKVPDGLCLMDTQRPSPGVSYVYGDHSIRYWLPDWLPFPRPPNTKETSKVSAIATSVCDAHQHQVVMDSGLAFGYQYDWNDWVKTPEGIDFIKATGWSRNGTVWSQNGVVQEYLDPASKASQACAHRYLDGALSVQERGWAERWLPLPPGK